MPPNTKIEPAARSCYWVVQHVPQSPDEHNLMSISPNSKFWNQQKRRQLASTLGLGGRTTRDSLLVLAHCFEREVIERKFAKNYQEGAIGIHGVGELSSWGMEVTGRTWKSGSGRPGARRSWSGLRPGGRQLYHDVRESAPRYIPPRA